MRRRAALVALTALLLSGCGSAVPAEEEMVPFPVYTDWSHLTPYEAPAELYTYAEGYQPGGTLTPRADYGTLLPYAGTYLDNNSYMGALSTLGLVTADGKIVTPPVYAKIEMPRRSRDISDYAPYLLLYRGQVTTRHQEADYTWVEGDFLITLAAPDGHWVKEVGACYDYSIEVLPEDRLALALRDGSILIVDTDGRTVVEFSRDALEPWLGKDYDWQWDTGCDLMWSGSIGCVTQLDPEAPDGSRTLCWLNAATGAITAEAPPDYQEPVYDPIQEERLFFPGYDTGSPFADPITGKRYAMGTRLFEDGSGTDLLDEEGNVIRKNCTLAYVTLTMDYNFMPWVWDDLIACTENGQFCYYRMDGNCVFRRTVDQNLD